MEKLIARWCYWLGIVCLVIAVIWKAVSVFRSWLPAATSGHTLGHSAFMHASILFLVATIASACYAWLDSRNL